MLLRNIHFIQNFKFFKHSLGWKLNAIITGVSTTVSQNTAASPLLIRDRNPNTILTISFFYPLSLP